MSKVLIVEDDRPLRHALEKLIAGSGVKVETAGDGVEAVRKLRRKYDLVLLDVGLPRLNGLEVLARLRKRKHRPRVIVMTADDTSDTVLRAIREQAYLYLNKPVKPKDVVELVQRALASAKNLPIEVLSAKADWVELLVPCDLESVERIQSFLSHLEADLTQEVRDSVGRAFRELLLNAVEWGGELDPNRKVRISYLRARRMLMYRIADPGPGFEVEGLEHAAIANPSDKPFDHVRIREEQGLRPGGFGIMLVKAVVDELIYNEARNEVVFVKYLD